MCARLSCARAVDSLDSRTRPLYALASSVKFARTPKPSSCDLLSLACPDRSVPPSRRKEGGRQQQPPEGRRPACLFGAARQCQPGFNPGKSGGISSPAATPNGPNGSPLFTTRSGDERFWPGLRRRRPRTREGKQGQQEQPPPGGVDAPWWWRSEAGAGRHGCPHRGRPQWRFQTRFHSHPPANPQVQIEASILAGWLLGALWGWMDPEQTEPNGRALDVPQQGPRAAAAGTRRTTLAASPPSIPGAHGFDASPSADLDLKASGGAVVVCDAVCWSPLASPSRRRHVASDDADPGLLHL